MKTYLNHELVTKDGWQRRTRYFTLDFKLCFHVQFTPNLAYLGYLLYYNEKGTHPHNTTIISPLWSTETVTRRKESVQSVA